MTNRQNDIEAAFARAKVPLKITRDSLNQRLVRGGGQIVQMDIATSGGGETVRMNLPADEDVDVRVLGGDPGEQQVVVLVKEPDRTFVERVWNRRTREHELRGRRVPGGKRRFLVGMDEQHLFIAQLDAESKATSVKQAHENLRPRGVPAGRRAKKLKVRRTGEWFLIPATAAEVEKIEAQVSRFGVRKKVGIGAARGLMRGRPHVVSESVIVGGTEFVRGRILHPDHKVVKLKTWHRVLMNTEDRSVSAQWVD
jgi:hypothetical protein